MFTLIWLCGFCQHENCILWVWWRLISTVGNSSEMSDRNLAPASLIDVLRSQIEWAAMCKTIDDVLWRNVSRNHKSKTKTVLCVVNIWIYMMTKIKWMTNSAIRYNNKRWTLSSSAFVWVTVWNNDQLQKNKEIFEMKWTDKALQYTLHIQLFLRICNCFIFNCLMLHTKIQTTLRFLFLCFFSLHHIFLLQ